MKVGDLVSFVEDVPVSISFLGRKRTGVLKIGTEARVTAIQNDSVEIIPTGILFNIHYDVPLKSVQVNNH